MFSRGKVDYGRDAKIDVKLELSSSSIINVFNGVIAYE